MNYNRQKLIIMIGQVVFFLALLLTFIILRNSFTPTMWVIYSALIAFAVAAIGIAIIGNRALHKKISTLPKEYQDVFVNAQDLISLHTKSYSSKKEIEEIVLEIFEHAALEHRDVNEVINSNLEQYIKDFLVDKPKKYNPLHIFLYSTSLFLFFILMIKTYKVLRADTISMDNFKTETLDLGITLAYLIIAYVFYPLLMFMIHYSAKNQLNSLKRLIVIIPLMIPVLLMFGLIFIDHPGMREFLDTPVELFTSLFTFLVGVVLMIFTIFLTIYSKE